ncbi:glycosyltransferase family 2 protein [Robertmurraya korlensis]|uniref:glycosyltransferase n=1 Tax=Robertmurraya korlensis TaxID=519977 RepID=UPI00204073B3|nr:glycosyltransferase [Robertmurraya korlensis]MCM3599681.1 glycosyltransferase family 2 protein [Robertmurraya korlensis]
MSLFLIVSSLLAISIVVWILIFIDAKIGLHRIDFLENEPASQEGPLVSIIVAARNEEKGIKESLQSQFLQSYGHLEWVLVNDRSTDNTPIIMNEMKSEHENVSVIHITSLPLGWLGKNHAMYVGAKQARGELLLFTDADVIFHKDAIAKAVHYTMKHKLDHLTAAPNLRGQRLWLNSFIAFFMFGFSYFKRPWLANHPRSKVGIGIGAFNLVRKEAYEKLGTHEVIKMRPDDDLMLGKKMKELGFRHRMVTALTLLEVEWYSTLKEALIGLEKNTFAGLHYRISMVMFAIFGVFVSQVLPFFTLFSFEPILIFLSIGNIFLLALIYSMIIKRMTTYSPWMFLLFPFTAMLFIYSIIRASFLTFRRGGIIWRGTKYRLKDLRNHNK